MFGIRAFWNTSNYRYFISSNHGWDQNVFVAEGVRDKWMHIAHLYNGKNVMVYVNGSRRGNFSKSDLDTGDKYTLQFGRWTDEGRYDRTFHGYLDDFRVYNDALLFSDIQSLYGGGNGDFKVIPKFDVDTVVESKPASGKVKFYRNGKLVSMGVVSKR
jgi:hypothetical protein